MAQCGPLAWALETQILEALEGEILARLAREHHEHDPFQLLGVELVGIERHHAVDDDLALQRLQHAQALEREQKAAAFGRQARQLRLGEDAHRAAARVDGRIEQRALAHAGKIREPIERPFDVGVRQSRRTQDRAPESSRSGTSGASSSM